MDVSEIISDIQDHGFSDTSTTRVMAMLNETYWDVLGREPWPFVETSVDLNFDGNSAAPTNWPTDFRAALKLFRISDGVTLDPRRADDMYEDFSDLTTNKGTPPLLYYFEDYTAKFYPVPASGNGQVTLKYLKSPAELSSSDVEATILLPARYHRGALVNGTLYKLYAMEDDTDLAAYFERLFEKTLAQMRADLWMRQYDRPDFIHTLDPDDVYDEF